MVLEDLHGIVESARDYEVCLRDNNTLWWDFRKTFSRKQRSRYKRDKHICLDNGLFSRVISYFWVTTYLMDLLENMMTTPALSQEFEEKTKASLEAELGATLEDEGRKLSFEYAAHDLSLALKRNEIHFTALQEKRYRKVHDLLKDAWEGTGVSEVNFDFFVRAVVCAETMGATAAYTNDTALFRHLLPKAQELVDEGKLHLEHPVDFYTTVGLDRDRYEKDHSLLPHPNVLITKSA